MLARILSFLVENDLRHFSELYNFRAECAFFHASHGKLHSFDNQSGISCDSLTKELYGPVYMEGG